MSYLDYVFELFRINIGFCFFVLFAIYVVPLVIKL